jgi:hypothetical protein
MNSALLPRFKSNEAHLKERYNPKTVERVASSLEKGGIETPPKLPDRLVIDKFDLHAA